MNKTEIDIHQTLARHQLDDAARVYVAAVKAYDLAKLHLNDRRIVAAKDDPLTCKWRRWSTHQTQVKNAEAKVEEKMLAYEQANAALEAARENLARCKLLVAKE